MIRMQVFNGVWFPEQFRGGVDAMLNALKTDCELFTPGGGWQ